MSEPAPVVTDEAAQKAAERAVFQARYGVDWDSTWLDEAKRDTARQNATATASVALEAAAPLLGPRPLLDREAVCEKIADWYSAHYNPDHDFFYETDDHGVKGDEDENATHAYRGFKLAQELARPMPTRWQIEAALGRGIRFGGNEDEHGKAVDAVLALLNGAGS